MRWPSGRQGYQCGNVLTSFSDKRKGGGCINIKCFLQFRQSGCPSSSGTQSNHKQPGHCHQVYQVSIALLSGCVSLIIPRLASFRNSAVLGMMSNFRSSASSSINNACLTAIQKSVSLIPPSPPPRSSRHVPCSAPWRLPPTTH